jgi:hypothetical protein
MATAVTSRVTDVVVATRSTSKVKLHSTLKDDAGLAQQLNGDTVLILQEAQVCGLADVSMARFAMNEANQVCCRWRKLAINGAGAPS